jgi:hypothetical protein
MAKKRASKRGKKALPAHAGLPAPDSVREIIEKVASTGRKFRILKTRETDSYDRVKRSGKK